MLKFQEIFHSCTRNYSSIYHRKRNLFHIIHQPSKKLHCWILERTCIFVVAFSVSFLVLIFETLRGCVSVHPAIHYEAGKASALKEWVGFRERMCGGVERMEMAARPSSVIGRLFVWANRRIRPLWPFHENKMLHTVMVLLKSWNLGGHFKEAWKIWEMWATKVHINSD